MFEKTFNWSIALCVAFLLLGGQATAQCTSNDFDELKACVWKKAGQACSPSCGDQKAFQRCFNKTATTILRKSGMRGESFGILLTWAGDAQCEPDCTCDWERGGYNYSCSRLNVNTIEECEGVDEEDPAARQCHRTNCPVRTCKFVCSRSGR